MSTIVSTGLIVAPLAFLAGWLLAKAMFRHLSVVRPAGAVQADRAAATEAPAQPAASGAVAELRRALQDKVAEAEALRDELRLARAGVAESEQRAQELRARLAEKTTPPEVAATDAAPVTHNEDVQRLLKAQQARVAQRDQRVAELEQAVAAAESRSAWIKRRFRHWRQRIRPLARQFRQQRTVISELREQLRQHDERQQRREARRAARQSPRELVTEAVAEASLGEPLAAAPLDTAPAQVANSDLQALRGVGPAMHRRLNEQGVYNLSQVAEMGESDLRRLARVLSLGEERVLGYDWVGQARACLGLRPPAVPAVTTPAVATVD